MVPLSATRIGLAKRKGDRKMGLPMKHILQGLKIGAAVAGVDLSDNEMSGLLKELVEQQKITNAVLLKILEDQDPDAFDELIKELKVR